MREGFRIRHANTSPELSSVHAGCAGYTRLVPGESHQVDRRKHVMGSRDPATAHVVFVCGRGNSRDGR